LKKAVRSKKKTKKKTEYSAHAITAWRAAGVMLK